MRSLKPAVLLALASAALAGACASQSQQTRSLHYVDGELVSSPPVGPKGYEAYFNAKIALQEDPPDLDAARKHLGDALRYSPRDPHLWTELAKVEERSGRQELAVAAVERALELEPSYGPARRVHARLRGGNVAQTAPSSEDRAGPR